MAFLPALLIRNTEELESYLSKISDIDTFMEDTGQDHYAFHLDIILPEFAESNACEPTLVYDELITDFIKFFEGSQLRLNIHIMGEGSESVEVASWIIDTFADRKIFGEIYVPFPTYLEAKKLLHHNWLVGVWYDQGEWNATTKFPNTEVLLMTVKAGFAGQALDLEQKSLAMQIADSQTHVYFVLDGGWRSEESPIEEHIEIAVNSNYWTNLAPPIL